MKTSTTLYRVMGKVVDEYGGESFVKFGPLRKSYASAIKAAEGRCGYVVDCASGRQVYQAPGYLSYTPKPKEKRDWQAFHAAQLFPSLVS